MSAVRAVVADDDADVRMLLEIAVRRAGIDLVGSHGDGTSALADALGCEPDILVLDHAMPGMTGIEVVRAIRREQPARRPHVVIVSAAVDGMRALAAEAGADDCVAKPFAVRELTERLRLAVDLLRTATDDAC